MNGNDNHCERADTGVLRSAVCLLLVVGCGLLPASGLGPAATGAVRSGLEVLGIQETELGFYKQWATDSLFRLKTVDFLLDNPLEVAAYTDSSAELFLANERNLLTLTWFQALETDVPLRPGDSALLRRAIESEMGDALEGTMVLPPNLGRAVNVLLAAFRVADRYRSDAVAGLSKEELDILVGEAPDFWSDEDDTLNPTLCGVLHREFGKAYDTTREIEAETLLAYVGKLDRRALALSGLAVVLAAGEAEQLLTEESLAFPHEAGTLTAAGVTGGVYFEAETDWGTVVIGADGENTYRRDCCVIIDLGGDDCYRNRAGGAVGVLGNPYSVLIDLRGDDLYATERLFSQGAALFGAGVLIDVAGNDVFRSGHYSQGAGVLGTGVLADRDGRDIHESGFYAQGAGMFGIGLLADARGDDSYRCWCYGQGFGSVHGYGLMLEGGGDDVYSAGGEYAHEPLLPHEYRSFAQGFAIGWRPDAAGGIGFLCDRSGNDCYNAEVFAQATSYWYSFGALWDGAGYDHYVAAQYSQGAGIHLAVGCLIDNEGNDSYYSRLGPSQGEGHDLSVGVLVDRKGHDVYHASGGQGTALTNSVGLFVDVTGNDVYSSTEKLALAGGRPARGFASVGNFADLAGEDHYTGGSAGSDFGHWTNGVYGVGLDLSAERVAGDEADEGDTLEVEADSLDLPVDSIFQIAAMWEVGNVRAKVRQARKQLKELGREAIDYVFEKKVATKSGLESRAIGGLLKEWPDTAKPCLYRALHDDRRRARANAVHWLGKLEEDAADAVDSLFLAMNEKRASPRWVAKALGNIGDSTVVPRILFLLEDDYEPSRIVTAEACGKLKNPVAVPNLIAGLEDRLFTVRSAAEMALEKIGRPGLEPLLDATGGQQSPALGHAIRVAGRIAAELDTLEDRKLRVRCRKTFLLFLWHEDPFVRLVTVRALAGFLDDPLRRILETVEAEETNRFVLSACREVLSERDGDRP